ncbi:phage tail tape measure protein [Lacipirellula parvula]|uniref:Phage tail tape measure protein domain-containing protein n=1 Tax=Lacipirellula parvula TaxID=2650471 RepID=A0A5K7XCP3_9BACT|nr:phage tail tape measure protein [Lacipirellula parvula]BBO34564.1 hypothetical protein PLANPX_4176 [Lacipirellula parvula]
MEEIKQVLGFDAGQAIAELTKLDNALVQLQQRLQRASSNFGQFNASAGKTVAAFIQLTKHGSSAAGAIAAVAAAQGNMNPGANMQAAASAAAQLATSMNQAGITGQSASVKIGNAMVRIGKQSQQTANVVQNSSVRMTTSLALLSRVVYTQAIVRALSTVRNSFRATANEAADFQKSISLIQTIDDSKQSTDSLAKSVRDLSNEFNVPLLETSAALYQTISNQVGDAAESQEFLVKALEFSKATNSQASASVDLLSGALKSFNLNASDTDKIASLMFKTIDLGRIEASELSNAFGRLGTISKETGLRLEEVLGGLSAISVRGSGTSESITQLRAIVSALLKPSEAMAKTLTDMGYESGEAALKSLGFVGVLEKLRESTGGSTSQLAKLFPNVRGLAGAASLTSDNLASLSANIREMDAAGRDFAHNKFLEATANDGERVRKEFNEIKNTFVTEVGGALLKATKQFLDTTEATENLTKAISFSVPVVDNLAAYIGLLVTQLAAAKLGAVGLSKALGVLALVPVAQGAGEIIGDKLNQIATARRNVGLNALEDANAKELKAFTDLQQSKIAAANAADQQIVANTRKAADLLNKTFSAGQIANLLDSDVGVTALEGLVGGKQIDTMGKLTAATESAVLKAAELRQKLAAAATAGQQLEPVRNEVNEALNSVRGTGNGVTGDFAGGLKTQLEALKTQLQDLAKSSNITDEQLNEVIAKRNEFGKTALAGENPLIGKLGFGQDIKQLDAALTKLRELKTLQSQAVVDPKLQNSLSLLNAVLAANPTGQFGGATQAMNGAVSPAQAIATAWERAAAAAKATAQAAAGGAAAPTNQAFGGMMHLASGGAARGIDTIPAMLSPGEFVMNAKSSRKFYSQLVAMNAGQTPTYRESGGSVTNYNIGDVNVNGVSDGVTNAREMIRAINRESRRGTERLR